MLRHRFQPGRLVAGAFLVLAGVIYAGDAGGLWETPWFVVIPVVVGGLCLAGAVGVVARTAHRRRGALRPGRDRHHTAAHRPGAAGGPAETPGADPNGRREDAGS